MANLNTNRLGRTGLEVTRLAYGAMELGGGLRRKKLQPGQAKEVLNAVLDAGINFIDTSIDYGVSEELIGEHISHRRSEFYLASKCGCPALDQEAPEGQRPPHLFDRENIVAGVEQSLRRMKTDHLDLVQFHAQPAREELEQQQSIQTLLDLKNQGKIRFIGMSSTLPVIEDHIEMDVFDAFQIPYSALQRQHEGIISQAARSGSGTVIRGGVARGAPANDKEWDNGPIGVQKGQAQDIWEKAKLDDLLEGMTLMEFVLRFTLSHPDLHATIVGTSNVEHLRQNVAAAAKGPLSNDLYSEAKRRLNDAVAQIQPS